MPALYVEKEESLRVQGQGSRKTMARVATLREQNPGLLRVLGEVWDGQHVCSVD